MSEMPRGSSGWQKILQDLWHSADQSCPNTARGWSSFCRTSRSFHEWAEHANRELSEVRVHHNNGTTLLRALWCQARDTSTSSICRACCNSSYSSTCPTAEAHQLAQGWSPGRSPYASRRRRHRRVAFLASCTAPSREDWNDFRPGHEWELRCF